MLLDTMVFLSGLFFALRSGVEHRRLSSDMLVLNEPKYGHAYVEYT